eukprot:COSAG01_NODE_3720_length_5764_cov_13.900618_3_plen_93_part_00
MHSWWPVLGNGEGMYCFHHASNDKWYLHKQLDSAKDAGHAISVPTDGPLPVGPHTWRVWLDGKYQERTLTVELLVRILTPNPAALLERRWLT